LSRVPRSACAPLGLCTKREKEVLQNPLDAVDSVKCERERLEFPRQATDDARGRCAQRRAGYASRVCVRLYKRRFSFFSQWKRFLDLGNIFRESRTTRYDELGSPFRPYELPPTFANIY